MNLKSWNKMLVVLIFAILISAIGCSENQNRQTREYADLINLAYAEDFDSSIHEWPDDMLKKRFSSYWHYRMSGKLQKSWSMEDPELQDSINQSRYETFFGRSKADSIEIEITRIEPETEKKYHVVFTMNIKRGSQEKSASLKDRWIILDETWYHVITDPLLEPLLS